MKTKKTVQKSASVTKEEAACVAYIEAVDRMYRTGKATEVSYRDALSPLLRALLPNRGVTNEPKPMERNKPDYTITTDPDGGLLIAIVETKKIGAGDLAGKKDSGYKEQFDRYKAAYQTIAFTDFLDFHFYENGAFVDSVRIGEVVGDGIRPLSENFGKFVALVERLGDAEPQTITSPTQLAQFMAAKARLLQVAAQKFLSSGNAKGSTLWELMEGFKRVLMPDTNADEFSDIYAQTLTYGMFAARLHDDMPEDFSREEAARLIPKSNPFLRKLFNHINSDIEDEIKWPVDDIVRLFAAADVRGIMKDYGKSKKRSDPMIHFYEDFLNAYDAGLRKDRGVWYTPLPVVRFIVRAVDDILVKQFGIADGIASRDMVQIEVTENCDTGKSLTKKVKKTVPKVQVLDPATGTGTFLAECINRIYGKFLANKGKWPGYVAENLIPRLNGFELLMAPYTMAHIKLDRVLADTGYEHNTDKRFNIFLTNSLEKAKDLSGTLFDILLGAEANAANAVKRDCPVMVVMGNPPYSGISQNNGKWISDLVADYKTEPGGKEKLKERKHWLNDDYVKFIRLAQDYVERRGEGVLAYINNHGLLDNPTFRGMRWQLLDCFDEIYVLNLHGNSMKHEKAPNGSKDENVFSITVGTAINIFVKTGKKKKGELAKVHYADLWGTRKDKFAYLESKSLATVGFATVTPTAPYYLLVPQNEAGSDQYQSGFGIDALLPINSTAVLTMGDSFAVAHTQDELKERISDINGKGYKEAELKAKYGLGKNYASFVLGNLPIDSSSNIVRYSYRPFDDRWVCFTPKTVWRQRKPVMQHIHQHDNIALVVCKHLATNDWNLVGVADCLVDDCFVSSRTKERGYVFPLYLYQDTLGNVEKVANFDKDVFGRIADGLKRKPSPEELFDYIYAVLHTPEYRERYREFLKVDFPRIPYPTNAAVFKKLAKIGGELRETHLLKAKPTASERNRIANFPKGGGNAVEDVRFANGKVYINDEQYFDHVPEEAWGMFIGGYQPAQKWLKDRKGHTLANEDIDHYQAIILALSRTRALMQKLSTLSKEWLG
ncbi:MAG: DNA methyltransferase [Kiritimatiellae bacterium]|nr:DNA methyltransferase [Kiritimatiellia bacterium]